MKKVSSNLFSMYTTTRLQCAADSKVKYMESPGPETVWSLRLPIDKAAVVVADEIASLEHKRFKAEDDDDDDEATGAAKEEQKPVPTIALHTCIKEWAAATVVEELRWPHLGNASYPATQTLRFTNFPRFIILQQQRYKLGP
jgi:hypothetical protein